MKRLNTKSIMLILIIISLIITSCENSPQGLESQNSESNENKEKVTVNESNPSKFTAQGKVIKIDNKGIHVQDQDKVDVYNVDPERTRNIYIGEFVGINKLEGEKFDVVRDENHDYNAQMTSEGKAINRITGTVKDIAKDNITVATDSG